MERPVRVDFPDDKSFAEAQEVYRQQMISYLEQEAHKYPSRSKEGCALRTRLYYWRHRNLCLERAQKYNCYIASKDPDRGKRYYAANRQKIRESARQFRIKHHDGVLEREAKHRELHREELNARARAYAATEAYREKQRKWREARRKPNPPVICPVCGTEFVKHNGFQRYCSKVCARIVIRAAAKQAKARRTPEQIEHYRERARNYAKTDKVRAKKKIYAQSARGKEVHAKASRNYKNSDKGRACMQRQRASQTYRIQRHRHDVRRRARKAEVSLIAVDPGIHWKTLAERVGSMKCAICGIMCDPDGETAVRPTVDHIIPISKGGTHTWDNVQLVCCRCNGRKCDKVPDLTPKTVVHVSRPVVLSGPEQDGPMTIKSTVTVQQGDPQ